MGPTSLSLSSSLPRKQVFRVLVAPPLFPIERDERGSEGGKCCIACRWEEREKKKFIEAIKPCEYTPNPPD